MSEEEMVKIGVSPFSPSPTAITIRGINDRELISENEVSGGIVGTTSGTLLINNYIISECNGYYYHVKSRIANLYISSPRSVSGELLRILNSTYSEPVAGSYPVRLSYTLPGNDVPISVTDVNLVWQ